MSLRNAKRLKNRAARVNNSRRILACLGILLCRIKLKSPMKKRKIPLIVKRIPMILAIFDMP